MTVPDPIALALSWLDAAARAGAPQPEAMALATANEQGHPSVRMVLMRGLDRDGFRFYTNRESRNGDELAARASRQSRELESRDELLDAYAQQQRRFGERPVERPPHWGGYLLVPHALEFWEHGEHRLHRRRQFRRNGNGWTLRQLAP